MASALTIKLPHNFDAILKRADTKVDKFSDKLKNQLVGGIFLDNQKIRFSVDEKSSTNVFWLYARGLEIASGNDKNCWNWTYMKDKDVDAYVEVAELLSMKNLSVKVKFPSQLLSPNTHYEVAFVLMMKEKSEGFEGHPVNLSLAVPDVKLKITCEEEDLSKMKKNEWEEIDVGDFKTSSDMKNDMEISLSECGCQVKKGLVVQKIVIRPIKQC